jgi:hypothetical protein
VEIVVVAGVWALMTWPWTRPTHAASARADAAYVSSDG